MATTTPRDPYRKASANAARAGSRSAGDVRVRRRVAHPRAPSPQSHTGPHALAAKPSATDGSAHDATRQAPALHRVLTLTDAVVAIAMTLLVLPLVDVAGQVGTGTIGAYVANHGNLFLSFAISFVVIYVFWAAHSVAFRRLEDTHTEAPALHLLNLGWLLLIAFLPFPTAVVGRELTTTSAPVYIGTMTVLSALTAGIITVTDRVIGPPRRTAWAWLTTAIFGLCALLSLVSADLGMLALLSVAVVRVVERRLLPRDPARRGDRPPAS
ncbi:TMEM175 family protein [Terrabacter sp. NPDC080008]|uniref:TMEM175 family protein n=1 Tax=Terrabacter sp. NPDC080008 TaxID=3155176 RepID=UPI00344D22F6